MSLSNPRRGGEKNLEKLSFLVLITGEFSSDAISQGVQADQIIFTDVAMKNEHIRRSALADLFLDT